MKKIDDFNDLSIGKYTKFSHFLRYFGHIQALVKNLPPKLEPFALCHFVERTFFNKKALKTIRCGIAGIFS